MNEPTHPTAQHIQTQINLAQTHLAQRDQILSQLAALDGRLPTLRYQSPYIERDAIKAKQTLDNLRGRVFPILRGWLDGAGSPEQQETAAEKVWQAAEETLTRHLNTIAHLEAEHEALEAELLLLATVDEELAQAHHARDQWLITHGGANGRDLATLINDIAQLTAEHGRFHTALDLAAQAISTLNKVERIFAARRLTEDVGVLEMGRFELTLETNGFDLDMTRSVYDNTKTRAQLQQANELTTQLQNQLTEIGERLWPDPKISWRNIPNARQAHLRVTQEIKKLTQKQERLNTLYQSQAEQLNTLTAERHTLTNRLWAAALHTP